MGIKEEIKQEKFTSNSQMAIVNLIYTSNWLRDHQLKILSEFDILIQHYNVIRIVKGKHPKIVYPGQIKEVILDKGRDLTRLIDKLVNMNYLIRNICENNRRMVEISITPKGLKVVDAIEKKLSIELKNYFKLSEKDALELSNLLDKLRG